MDCKSQVFLKTTDLHVAACKVFSSLMCNYQSVTPCLQKQQTIILNSCGSWMSTCCSSWHSFDFDKDGTIDIYDTDYIYRCLFWDVLLSTVGSCHSDDVYSYFSFWLLSMFFLTSETHTHKKQQLLNKQLVCNFSLED